MPDSPHIRTERPEPHIALVVFDRPEKRNAFDLAMWETLGAVMRRLSDDESLRCVVLRGAGAEAFSAGADISAFAAERGTRAKEDRYGRVLHESLQALRTCRHPTVAMIRGVCIGGGAGIATMCDFRVGGEGIRFGITARNLGIWYPYAEMDPVVQIAGYAVAAEVFIEGRIFTGTEAHQKGLLSRVVPDDRVEEEAMALARRIAEGAPLSARFHKRALQRLRGPLPITPEEEEAVADFILTADFQNAYRAFLAKRKPVFEGR
ncbi:enoyl-CoA hydratase/isomerase family protein [Elioraea sp.]|jgi:enoyl-CoA hydratase/carnithine racemase|uniref:enoyl-CoA hydratase/isomerase family protein n=1 Tax=Elioraea sp. TaxID=2185103 RepID=UPI0021DED13D|nr:enoyl-CoA hydratase-related protein [Elioraea sp.]GIX08557.1 MAG: enoyl-CoA hydratase [Elioraea sp.]